VLIYGQVVIPGIFLGQLLFAFASGLAPLSAIGISIINSMEAYLAILLFNAFSLDKQLQTIKDLFLLLGGILFILQPFSALLGNTLLTLLDPLHFSDFYHNAFVWW